MYFFFSNATHWGDLTFKPQGELTIFKNFQVNNLTINMFVVFFFACVCLFTLKMYVVQEASGPQQQLHNIVENQKSKL